MVPAGYKTGATWGREAETGLGAEIEVDSRLEGIFNRASLISQMGGKERLIPLIYKWRCRCEAKEETADVIN